MSGTGGAMLVAGRRSRDGMLRAGAAPLVVDESGGARSGHALASRVDRLAAVLFADGLAGRRVGLWFRNGIAAMEAFLAVERIGGVRVPVDPGVPAAEAASILLAAGVDVVLTDAEHAPLLGGLPHRVHDDVTTLPAAAPPPWQEVGDAPCLVYARTVRDGVLEAVTFSYRNWDAIMATNIALYCDGGYGPPLAGPDRGPADHTDELLLTTQQIMHGTGLLGTFPFVCLGLPQLVMRTFDAEAVVDAVDRHGVTSTVMISAMVSRITEVAADRPQRLRSLRRVVYGGAPLSRARVRAALAVFGPTLVQVYGRIEAGWPLSVLGPDGHAAQVDAPGDGPVGCGTAVPGVDLEIAGRIDGPAEGLLRVRTPMSTADVRDADGWCDTGDLLRRDADGALHHRGRTDRQITSFGYHVYPEEIEALIGRLSGVVANRVVSEPDPRWGATLVAYLVTDSRRRDPGFWASTVTALLESRLARHKIPRRVELVDALP